MSTALSLGLLGGGVLAGGAALGVGLWAWKRSNDHVEAVHEAVKTGGTVKIRTTGYWPYVKGLTAKERKMEGGIEGAAVWRGKRAIDPNTGKRPVIHTLEMHLKDPSAHPYVSLSGDPMVWPWGQRIVISYWPNVIFRFVDTGSHFTGLKKMYRVAGKEPVDVAVDSPKTKVSKKNVTAQIVKGDNWAGGVDISTAGLKDQRVTGALPLHRTIIGAEALIRSAPEDAEALARALESCCGRGSIYEKQAVAWACRNRAARMGIPVAVMLAPDGVYGARDEGRDYVSTAAAPSEESTTVAKAVLALPADRDPTSGAIDFWFPQQQTHLKALGDAHRAAVESGDEETAAILIGYAGYAMAEPELRAGLQAAGFKTCGVVGDVELLVG